MNFFHRNNEPNNDSGEVKIVNGVTVKSSGRHKVYDCEFNLNAIEYAYLVVNSQLESYLFVFTNHPVRQNFISVQYKGFQKVYDTLSEKYGFNDALFKKYVQSDKPLKACIWRRRHAPNYEVVNEPMTDLGDGFEIQSPEKEFVSWDMPLGTLRQKSFIEIKPNSFGSHTLSFKFPVRLGNLILNNLQTTLYKDREDMPLLTFSTSCFDESNTDRSYRDIKQLFLDAVKTKNPSGYERKDQKHTSFTIKGITFSITYTYDSEYGFESGDTSLTIANNREYNELLVNKDYEDKMEVSKYLILKKGIHFQGLYQRNSRIKRTPPKLELLCGGKPAIWLDNKNGKIGYAANGLAHILGSSEIVDIKIQNTLPAKGAGRADMELNLKTEEYNYAVFSGNCKDFDSYVDEIEKVTEKKVIFLPETMDC